MNKGVQLPYSREAENYVLGSILIENDLAIEFCGRLSVDDFYFAQNRKIYQVIFDLNRNKEVINAISVIEELKKSKKFNEEDEAYILELIDAVPTIVTTESYVEILKKRSLEREIYYWSVGVTREIINGDADVSKLISKAETDIKNISNKQTTGKLNLLSVAMEEVFNVIDANKNRSEGSLVGLDTGYPELNEYTYGFQPGELIILAARPGVGKSALALNIAKRACENVKAKVAFFALEMGTDQLIMRLLSTASNVKLSKIRNGDMTDDEVTRLLGGREALDSLKLYIDESTNNNMEDIKIQCRKLKNENQLDFIIIDYLQLLSATKGRNKMSRYEEVSSLSRNLKLLARELKVPVLALSQLSRASENRKNEEGASNKPILSDLRESGSIEQDADIVIFLHRDSVNEDASKKVISSKVEVIIAKNRQGMTGSFNLIFRGDCSAFESIDNKKNK